MDRWLVIGGSSFVGRHLVTDLTDIGYDVVASGNSRCRPATDYQCDITDAKSVFDLVEHSRPSVVVQCAGVTDPHQAELARSVHISGMKNTIRAIKECSPDCVLVALGSAAEYGPAPSQSLPLSEDYRPQPSGSYGETKLAQTKLIQQIAAQGMRALAVRPFNIIGPELPQTYFAAGLARRLRSMPESDASFELFNATATRDFVDVRDVARAIRMLVENYRADASQDCGRAVYNVCANSQTSLLDVATLLGQLAGGKTPVDSGDVESRSGISCSEGSFQKLHTACGWAPSICWQNSISDLWNSMD